MIVIQPTYQILFFGPDPLAPPPPPLVASMYRFLEDHYVGGSYFSAGTTAVTSTGTFVAGLLPPSWVPTPNVDPINSFAVQDFYNAGPGRAGKINQQFQVQAVPPPVTYWTEVTPGSDVWVLTGLGSNQTTFPPQRGLRKARPE